MKSLGFVLFLGVAVLLAVGSYKPEKSKQKKRVAKRPTIELGRWTRVGDAYQGLEVQLISKGSTYQAKLTKLTPKIAKLGFKSGEIKWDNISYKSATKSVGIDLYKGKSGNNYVKVTFIKLSSRKLQVKRFKDDGSLYSVQTWIKKSPASSSAKQVVSKEKSFQEDGGRSKPFLEKTVKHIESNSKLTSLHSTPSVKSPSRQISLQKLKEKAIAGDADAIAELLEKRVPMMGVSARKKLLDELCADYGINEACLQL